jgi:hypothetical protein
MRPPRPTQIPAARAIRQGSAAQVGEVMNQGSDA